MYKHKYDANTCVGCLCNFCKNSVEIEPFLDEEECKKVHSCFNCDECFYYGMDNEKLIRKFTKKCEKFEMSKYYVELFAKRKRNKFKIIKR